ncbi:sugar kinase [Candidatus Micrarchaeota archaeon RBG_16_49_10]|nr:MAG: sugar kinase [Candidatus Micrarchaeota archaeon RBG_16_49_10]
MIVSVGSIGIDTTRTPFKTAKDVLGGAATYSSLAASFFERTHIVGVIGGDFPKEYMKIFKERFGLSGLKIVKDGKTFRYDSTFDYSLSTRKTNSTDLNVLAGFEPKIPSDLKKAEYVYLGNNDPEQNILALKQFSNPKLSVCDTIDLWINTKKDTVIEMMGKVDVTVLNDEEIRLLTKQSSLIKAARDVLGWGSNSVIIKKGEHGTLLFSKDSVFPAPGFPLEDVVDPTGAGDSFGGGFIGHMARSKKADFNTMKEAVIYGNVMGSFAVEDFSINKFLKIKLEDIEKRYEKYRNIVSF